MRDYKLRKRVYNSFVDGEKLEKKTSAMTTPVGVDEEGKLWTSGGGGGTPHYLIQFIDDSGSAEDDGSYDITFRPVVDYFFCTPANEKSFWLSSGESYTISISVGENTGGVYGVSFWNDEDHQWYDVFYTMPKSLYVYEYQITNKHTTQDVSNSIRVQEVTL